MKILAATSAGASFASKRYARAAAYAASDGEEYRCNCGDAPVDATDAICGAVNEKSSEAACEGGANVATRTACARSRSMLRVLSNDASHFEHAARLVFIS